MSKKIDYIIKHERFPFTNTEKITLGGIAALVIAGAILAFDYYHTILSSALIIILALLIIYVIYTGLASSMAFHPVETRFNQEKNEKIIQMCLSHLNMKAYRDNEHDNVFVCFVHNKYSDERQDIYIIAKDEKVLINSNKEKESDDEQKGPDFVEKIGLSIYITARRLKALEQKNQ